MSNDEAAVNGKEETSCGSIDQHGIRRWPGSRRSLGPVSMLARSHPAKRPVLVPFWEPTGATGDPATEAGWWHPLWFAGGQPGKHLKAPAYSGPPDVSAHKLTKELPSE